MKKLLQSLFLLMFIAGSVMAQDRTVTGVITDQEDGKPLPGVTIRIKGTKIGTQTGSDGKYGLSVPSGSTSLEFSYLGYVTQNKVLGSGNVINISLVSDSKGLNEVVVVGYGTKSIKDINGAQGHVDGSRIKDVPTSFDNALSGKTAGVQISSAGGTLGDGVSIRVRGVGSISTSSLPLIVIDGIPANSTENVNSFNSGNGTRFNPLALINPNDIESIEVLKDAGSAVIYGSRAANGVILVTTKKGKKGTAIISFDSKASWAKASKIPDLLNGDDFMAINNEKVYNRYGKANVSKPVAVDSDIDGDGKPDRTDWMKEIYGPAFTHDNSASVSGGSDKATFFGSVRYADQKGISYGNRLKTGSARINVDVTPKKWIRSGVEISYSKSQNFGVLTDGYLAGSAVSGWNAFPTVSSKNPNLPAGAQGYNLAAGYLGLGNNVTNPSIIINGKPTNVNLIGNRIFHPLASVDLQRNENTPQNFLGNAYVELQPIPGLKITTKYGVDYLSNFEDQYSNPLIAGLGDSYGGLVQNNILNRNQWVWQNYVSYDKTFGKHRVNITAGAEYQHLKSTVVYASANNFADPFFTNIIDGVYTSIVPGTDQVSLSSGGDIFSNGMESYFARGGYVFDDKYSIEGAFRADAFSGFGADNQWGHFPSVSAGWVVSKEGFLQDNKYVDYLKVRGSYGLVGNSRGVASYAARTLYAGGSYAALNGFSNSQTGNPSLRWEASKKFNIGFDANILKNRIGVVFDYFNTDISDLILNAPVLYTVGVPNSTVTSNIGSMKNSGFEITFNTTNIKNRDFSWTSSINFTHIKNKVTELVSSNNNAPIVSGNNVAMVDKALGTYKLLNWVGVDPGTGNPMWKGKDGVVKMYDFNTQGYKLMDGTATTPFTADDAVYQDGKTGLPTYYGGFDNTFTYKDFDLNLSLVYQGGNYLYNSSRSQMLTNTLQNNFSEILDRWTTPGQKTDIPRVWSGNNTANNASTRFLEKGDFLRLRSASLGYTIKNEWAQKAGFSSLRVSAQVFNVFVLTNYKGLDPEVNSNRNNSNIATGLDNRAVPQPRTFMLGLNASF
jgi:TonB-linked SusC/RagA family outer membrane protein